MSKTDAINLLRDQLATDSKIVDHITKVYGEQIQSRMVRQYLEPSHDLSSLANLKLADSKNVSLGSAPVVLPGTVPQTDKGLGK